MKLKSKQAKSWPLNSSDRYQGKARLRKNPLTLLLIPASTVLAVHPSHALDANALPIGGVVVQGSGTISQTSASHIQVRQTSERMVANWSSFNVGSNAAVEFSQPSAQSVALNRVLGSDPSQVFGRLSANGQVFLLNPNGIVFGQGAKVDVGGLVASSLSLTDEDFLSRRYRFSGAGGATGVVANAGEIVAGDGGYAVLLGGQVSNSGTIAARGGSVALVAGDHVTFDLTGDGLINLSVDRAALGALVENEGVLRADGGMVVLSAHAAETLSRTVLNQSGVVEARSIQERGGRIYLDGGASGETYVSGTLDASGKNENETGGAITVLGRQIGLLPDARLDASGHAGGGTVLVGGNWQGLGQERHASAVSVTPTARINADALHLGAGGKVVLWSTDYTGFYGSISARGGEAGGNGGKVETSSQKNLQVMGAVDAAASAGLSGSWLLDPANVTITSSTSNGMFDGSNPNLFTPTSATATVNIATINSSLDSGTDVTIQTAGATGGGGDITVAAAISKSAGGDATLKLLADRHIVVNSGITSSSGKLNVLLNSRVTDGSTGRINVNAPITTNGGNVSLVGGAGANGFAIGTASTPGVLIGGAINAGGGNVVVKGQGSNSGSSTLGIYSSANVSTSGTGTINLTGVGGTGGTLSTGINLDTGSAFSTELGAISLIGNASDAAGIAFGLLLGGTGTRTFSSMGGDITFTGVSSAAGHAIRIAGATSVSTAGNGNISFNGTAGLGQQGINVARSLSLSTDAGDINLRGEGNGGGIAWGNASTLNALSNSGNIELEGVSTSSATGFKIDPAFVAFNVASTEGNVSLSGSSIGGSGFFQNGAALSLAAGGNIDVSGNNGLLVSGNAASFNATAEGNIAITGTGAGSSSGILIDGGAQATITTTGNGTIALAGSAGATGAYGIGLSPTSGATKVYSTGGGSLSFAGAAAVNRAAIDTRRACVGHDCTMTGNTRDVGFSANSGTMNLGTIRAGGNVSAINSGAAISDTLTFSGNVNATGTLVAHTLAGNLVVGSGTTLTANSSGTNAIQLGAGISHSSGDATGGNVILNGSLATPSSRSVVWTGSVSATATGTNFRTMAPLGSGRFRYGRAWGDTTLLGNAPNGGLMVQYRERPTLTLRVTNVGAVYNGTPLNIASFSQTATNYSATGSVNGDNLAITGLTGSLAFNGSTNATVRNAGTYVVTQSNVSSLAGYDVKIAAPVNYTVRPALLTVTATSTSKVYDRNTASSAIPTITAGTLYGDDSVILSQSFDTRDVGTGKTLTPVVLVEDGNGGRNYGVTTINDHTGVIHPRPSGVDLPLISRSTTDADPSLEGVRHATTRKLTDLPLSPFICASSGRQTIINSGAEAKEIDDLQGDARLAVHCKGSSQ